MSLWKESHPMCFPLDQFYFQIVMHFFTIFIICNVYYRRRSKEKHCLDISVKIFWTYKSDTFLYFPQKKWNVNKGEGELKRAEGSGISFLRK